jgi:hypothetical protein
MTSRRLRRAADVPLRPTERVWYDLLVRGCLNVIAGRAGAGKSLTTALIASHLSQLGQSVLLSNVEDSDERTTKARLMAAGADMGRVAIYAAGQSPVLPGGTEALVADIRSHDATAVILDPIQAHVSLSLYGAAAARRALEPLAIALDVMDVTAVLVHHTIKTVSKRADPITAIGGASGGLSAVARVIHLLGCNPSQPDEQVLVPLKYNVGEAPEGLAFSIDEKELFDGGESLISAGVLKIIRDDVTVDPRAVLEASGLTEEDLSELARAAEWLTTYLSNGPQAMTQVRADAEAIADISLATLKRAAKDVGVVKRREGFGPGSHVVWELPPGHPGRRP